MKNVLIFEKNYILTIKNKFFRDFEKLQTYCPHLHASKKLLNSILGQKWSLPPNPKVWKNRKKTIIFLFRFPHFPKTMMVLKNSIFDLKLS